MGLDQGQQTTAQEPNPAHTYFCAAHKLRMLFTFVKGWKKKSPIFYDTWKLYEIHISVSINKVLWEHSHAHSLHFACGFCPSTTAGWISCHRDSLAPKAKMFTIWPFTKRLWPLSSTIILLPVREVHSVFALNLHLNNKALFVPRAFNSKTWLSGGWIVG